MANRFLIAAGASLLVALPAAAADTWCSKDETTYFSCKIKGSEKVLSVCGKDSYLQYRFGKPGRIELQFPKNRVDSRSEFTVDHEYRQSVGTNEDSLRFASGAFHYRVFYFSYPLSQEKDLGMGHGAGVEVARDGQTRAELQCDGAATSALGDLTL
jgi:hypothetical protein